MENLNIRMYTWFQGGLSWAYVMSRLAQAFDEELHHKVSIVSTNGLEKNVDEYLTEKRMLDSVLYLQQFGPGKKQIDLDLTYTVPQNFPQRFLANSKFKAAIYNYETTYWDPNWRRFYNLVDFYFPSSNFSAEVFLLNGVPSEKIFVIPHGVDTKVFNPNINPIKLKTKKSFKFVSVCAPHYRKNLPGLLNAYCRAFTNKDDVCLVLKTKIYKHSDGILSDKNPKGRRGFEIVLGDTFKELKDKFGNQMPEIEILNGHVANVASIYNACQCHISTTGAEGFGMPFIEAMASNLINIAPRYSGHLDFLNDENSLLINTYMRDAKPLEQYWTFNPKSKIGQIDINHAAELMIKVYKEYNILFKQFKPKMEKLVKELSWKNAAQKIINVMNKKIEPYKPGTYNCWPK